MRVLGVAVVQDLKLAHAIVGCVTFAGIADRQAVVACRGKLELDSGHEVGQFLVEVDRAAFMRLAAQDAVLDFVVLDRPGPGRPGSGR